MGRIADAIDKANHNGIAKKDITANIIKPNANNSVGAPSGAPTSSGIVKPGVTGVFTPKMNAVQPTQSTVKPVDITTLLAKQNAEGNKVGGFINTPKPKVEEIKPTSAPETFSLRPGKHSTDNTKEHRYRAERGTIKPQLTPQQDISTLIAQKAAEPAENYRKLKDTYPDLDKWMAASSKDDFKDKSAYNAQIFDRSKVSANPLLGGRVYVGEGNDIMYAYVNGDKEAQDIVAANDVGVQSHVGWKDLPKETVGVFNYIYATEGKDKAYDYLQMLEDTGSITEGHIGAEALMQGFLQGSGITSAVGVADKVFGGDGDGYKKLSIDATETAQQYSGLYAAGNIAGGLALMTAASAGVGAMTGAIEKIPGVAGWAEKVLTSPVLKNALKTGATFAATRAVGEAGATAQGEQSVEDYIRNVGKSFVGGVAGGVASGAISNLATEAIKSRAAAQLSIGKALEFGQWAKLNAAKDGWLPPLAVYTTNVLSGMGFAGADALTTYLLSEDGSADKTTAAIRNRLISGFLFSTISSASNLIGYATRYSDEIDSRISTLLMMSELQDTLATGGQYDLAATLVRLTNEAQSNAELKTNAERGEWVKAEALKRIKALYDLADWSVENLTATGMLNPDNAAELNTLKGTLTALGEYIEGVQYTNVSGFINESADFVGNIVPTVQQTAVPARAEDTASVASSENLTTPESTLPQYTPQEQRLPSEYEQQIADEILSGVRQPNPIAETQTSNSAIVDAPTNEAPNATVVKPTESTTPTRQQLLEAEFEITSRSSTSEGATVGPFNFSVEEKFTDHSASPRRVGYIKDPDGNVIAAFTSRYRNMQAMWENMVKAITDMGLPINMTAEEYRSLDSKFPPVTTPNPETGKPYTGKLFHGVGKAPEDVYNGPKVPLLGKGTYYAMTKEGAAEYGDDITERQVTLEKPYVIKDDSDLYSLSRAVGYNLDSLYYDGDAAAAEAAAKTKEYLLANGYDGVVVQYEYEERGDINYKTGGTLKRIRNLFNGDQVVSYKDADRLPGSLHSTAPSEQPASSEQPAPSEQPASSAGSTVPEARVENTMPSEPRRYQPTVRPRTAKQQTTAVNSFVRQSKNINGGRTGMNGYTVIGEGSEQRYVMLNSYSMLALSDDRGIAGNDSVTTVADEAVRFITDMYTRALKNPQTGAEYYYVDPTELKRVTPKGNVKADNDSKARFVEIGGKVYNAQILSPVLSAIENPIIQIADVPAPGTAIIFGDNGSGLVCPVRPRTPDGVDMDGRTVYGAYTLDGDILRGAGLYPESDNASTPTVHDERDAVMRSVFRTKGTPSTAGQSSDGQSQQQSIMEDSPKASANSENESIPPEMQAPRFNDPSEWQRQPKVNPAEPSATQPIDIINKASHDFGLNISEGRMRQRAGVSGFFRPRDNAIRSRTKADVATVSHEIGHALDTRYGFRGLCNTPELQSELLHALGAKGANYDPSVHFDEGFAEYIRRYATNSQVASADYPKLTELVRKSLSGKELAALDDFANNVNSYFSRVGTGENTRTVARESKAPDYRTAKERLSDAAHQAYQNWVDRYHSLQLIDNAVGSNVHTLATNSAYADSIVGNILTNHLTDMNGAYVAPGYFEILEGNGIRGEQKWQDFGDYLKYRQAPWYYDHGLELELNPAENNAAYANARADELLQANPEFAQAEQSIREFIGHVVDTYGVATGLLSPEQVEAWRADNPLYVPMYRLMEKAPGLKQKLGGVSRGGKTIANQTNPIQHRRGGNQAVINPLDNIMDLTAKLVNAGIRNNIMRTLCDAALANDIDASVMTRIPPNQVATRVNTAAFKGSANAEAIDAFMNGQLLTTDPTFIQDFGSIIDAVPDTLTVFRQGSPSGNAVTVMLDGHAEWWEINDPLLLQSLTEGMSPGEMPLVLKAFGAATRFITGNLTANNVIWSLGSNAPRDFITMLMRTPNIRDTLVNYAASYANYFRQNFLGGRNVDPEYATYLGLGGGGTGVWQEDPDMARKLRAQLTSPAIINALRNFNPLSLARNLAEAVESGPRYAIYLAYRHAGIEPQGAFYLANQAMTDFRRKGVNTRYVAPFVPFFGASFQGPDGFYRWLTAADYAAEDKSRSVHISPIPPANQQGQQSGSGSNRYEQRKRANYEQTEEQRTTERDMLIRQRAAKFVMASMAASALTYVWNHKDKKTEEAYNQLSNYTKFSNWVFMTDDGKAICIPKNREMAVLTTAMNAILDYIAGEDKDAFEGLFEHSADNLLPKGVSEVATTIYNVAEGYARNKAHGMQALKDGLISVVGNLAVIGPVFDVTANRDFLGRPIVSESKNLEDKDYYNQNTSKLAKIMGDVLNWQPQMIDHVGDSTLGYMWDIQSALFPVGGAEYADPTIGISGKYVKDIAYSQDTTNWLYDAWDDAEAHKNSHTDPSDEKYAEYQLDFAALDMYKKFWSNFNFLNRSNPKADTARVSRIEALEMLDDYKQYLNGHRSGEASNEAQQWVYDIAMSAKDGEGEYSTAKNSGLLPGVMPNKITDTNGRKITLTDEQYLQFQKDFLNTYWSSIDAIYDSNLSQAEAEEKISTAKQTAYAAAETAALRRAGGAYDKELYARLATHTITDPRQMKYTKVDWDIVQAIIETDNDRAGNSYSFVPSKPTAKTYSDPDNKGRQYVIDEEWGARREEKYYELYNLLLGEVLTSKEYQKADIADKERMLRQARNEISDTLREWTITEMKKAGVQSQPKEG